MDFIPPLHLQFPSNVFFSHLSPFSVILLPIYPNLFSPIFQSFFMNAMISSTLLQMLIILVKKDFECYKISYSEMLFLKALKILFPNSIILLLCHDECLWHLCLGYYGASGDRHTHTWNNWKKKDNTRGRSWRPWTADNKRQRGSAERQEIHKVSRQPPQRAYCLGRLHRPQHRGADPADPHEEATDLGVWGDRALKVEH